MLIMHTSLFYFFLLFSFLGIHNTEAQDIKKKKKGDEIFYVLDSDPSIRQGAYLKVNSKVERIKGQYDANKKVGLWEYYDRNGSLEQIYDYDNQQLIESNSPASLQQNFYIWNGGEVKGSDFEQVPLPVGGWSIFYEDIVESFVLPKNIQSDGLFYTWEFLFWVNEHGKLIRIELLDTEGDHEEIALRTMRELVKTNDFSWIPAIYKGEKVQFGFKVPITKR
jgi:hypothetical protein